ncbi:putative uncharacterized protein DDB_G0274435 [Exaiptasia diaphana]|uniref:Uncharacterized protein n=1 Tax=Exaiptasia diaphana TaxID=2652724 RepID=A0A913WWU0_EXADI|nr:putative uncharacterized protein DDB_G0274435 [Exaiptasia diaphana]KXJ17208.1 hypothetical protein AC249_AIPGENE12334 [Exaiptasia diaphana]
MKSSVGLCIIAFCFLVFYVEASPIHQEIAKKGKEKSPSERGNNRHDNAESDGKQERVEQKKGLITFKTYNGAESSKSYSIIRCRPRRGCFKKNNRWQQKQSKFKEVETSKDKQPFHGLTYPPGQKQQKQYLLLLQPQTSMALPALQQQQQQQQRPQQVKQGKQHQNPKLIHSSQVAPPLTKGSKEVPRPPPSPSPIRPTKQQGPVKWQRKSKGMERYG